MFTRAARFTKIKTSDAGPFPKGSLWMMKNHCLLPGVNLRKKTGTAINGNFIHLSTIKQKGGKTVYAWAVEGDVDAENIVSNNFEMIWPPGSGVLKSFPENDRGAWFSLASAREKIIGGQIALLDELVMYIAGEII